MSTTEEIIRAQERVMKSKDRAVSRHAIGPVMLRYLIDSDRHRAAMLSELARLQCADHRELRMQFGKRIKEPEAEIIHTVLRHLAQMRGE